MDLDSFNSSFSMPFTDTYIDIKVLTLTFENGFSGIIYSLFYRGRQNIFKPMFRTKFVLKYAAKILKID